MCFKQVTFCSTIRGEWHTLPPSLVIDSKSAASHKNKTHFKVTGDYQNLLYTYLLNLRGDECCLDFVNKKIFNFYIVLTSNS